MDALWTLYGLPYGPGSNRFWDHPGVGVDVRLLGRVLGPGRGAQRREALVRGVWGGVSMGGILRTAK